MNRREAFGRKTTAMTIRVEHVTERAVKIRHDNADIWIPKSAIEREPDAAEFEVGESYDVEIANWLLKKEGLL